MTRNRAQLLLASSEYDTQELLQLLYRVADWIQARIDSGLQMYIEDLDPEEELVDAMEEVFSYLWKKTPRSIEEDDYEG